MDQKKLAKIAELRVKLGEYPKIDLVNFLTPIEPLRNVSADIGLETLVKREDLVGPAFGGHYAHSMEYVFGEVIEGGYDGIVQGGPSHSNQNRLIAAICAKLGLKAHLVLRKKLEVDQPDIGNLFLDQLVGADISWVTAEMGPELDGEKTKRYLELREVNGENPYLFRRDRISLISTLGMLDFFLKLYEQLDRDGKIPSSIYLTGCGPTHSGILLGARLIDPSIKIVGVRPLHWDAQDIVSNEVNTAAKTLGEQLAITRDEVVNPAEYVGKDYGILTREGARAIQYFAMKEGLIFDPVYTGKMAACFLDDAHLGKIEKGSRVLLIHSGGTPLTLLYSRQIYSELGMSLMNPSP